MPLPDVAGEEKSLYEFEGTDYKGYENGMAPFSVSLPKRNQGGVKYDENEYYRSALSGKERGDKGPRMMQTFDFQFFDLEKLEVLRPCNGRVTVVTIEKLEVLRPCNGRVTVV